jgi:glycosyltransferase involved in cell wall biosynthesis
VGEGHVGEGARDGAIDGARDGAVRVAINAQLASFGPSVRNAGISRYITMLLQGLGQLDDTTREDLGDQRDLGDLGDQRYTAFVNAGEASAAAASPLAGLPRLRLVPSGRSGANPLQRVAWEQLTLPGELRRLGADVFHAPANVLPARLPCPAVVTVHDLAFFRYPQFFRPTRRYYQQALTRRSVAQASHIVAVSESTKRDLVECLRVSAARVSVVYTGIAPDFQPPRDPRALDAFRARYSLPERYLLYLGTLEPRKNLTALVEAYSQARARDPDTPPLMLAGAKGWYYQPLFERVRALGLERAITFVGYVSRAEQPLWYAGAAAFIYPSLYEGFGLPVLEALACGTPTITSSVSSLPEAAGPVALQVAPTKSAELAHALQSLLADEAARRRMAVEGPRWAGRFTPARMAEGYAAIYQTSYRRAAGAERAG